MHLRPLIILIFLMANTALFADSIHLVGTVTQPIKTTPRQGIQQQHQPKTIKLLQFKLNKQAQDFMKKRINLLRQPITLKSTVRTLPIQVQLGMNQVPVLDQGQHGSCVTFASTAALNAELDESNYISQLCLLQLGNYLEPRGYEDSGWDGTTISEVFDRITRFGVINQDKQSEFGCGDLTAYPLNSEETPSSYINLDDYHQMSEGLEIASVETFDFTDALMSSVDPNHSDFSVEKVVDDVKKALSHDQRVVVGVLLPSIERGTAGAVGNHHVENDTWVLSPEISRDLLFDMFLHNLSGHAMVITGYDDLATATDDHGRQYQGLFTLRNSWGETAGDHGDFYMTYDYFKTLVIEARRIQSAELGSNNNDEDKRI